MKIQIEKESKKDTYSYKEFQSDSVWKRGWCVFKHYVLIQITFILLLFVLGVALGIGAGLADIL